MNPSSGRSGTVKNKTAASIQVSAEQILREAHDRLGGNVIQAPKRKITSVEELQEFRLTQRKSFEDQIRKDRSSIGAWIRYAAFEEKQNEFDRARSIFERCLDEDYTTPLVWAKYGEMELRHKHINRARNVFDRAVTVLPRASQLWYKYVYMEEVLGNYSGCREVFDRWMDWQPDERAWNTYIKFEIRRGTKITTEGVLERYVASMNIIKAWLRYTRYEEGKGDIPKCREVFTRAVEALGEDGMDQDLFLAFARFEESQKEIERARAIYKYALDTIPRAQAQELFTEFAAFEKRSGSRDGIEDVIVSKSRFQYEAELQRDGLNYDVWFDFLRLEEEQGDKTRVHDLYERAIAQVPPVAEKKYWRRYIYLWLFYAVFEELTAKDIERTRAIFKKLLTVIPHQQFSFPKVWVLYSSFEIRQKNVAQARRILGHALGHTKSPKVFDHYIDLEMQLGEVDRARTLYGKYLESYPHLCDIWTRFTKLEEDLGESERARALFEVAIAQQQLDLPESIWKKYIDFEISGKEYSRVRALYQRLLNRTKHIKVWSSYAEFERSVGNIEQSRDIFKQANSHFKEKMSENTDNNNNIEAVKEERFLLLEEWQKFESSHGTPESLQKVTTLLPKKIKKKRLMKLDDGSDAGWEEYYHYVFPGEEASAPNMKLLERAYLWKRQKNEHQ